MSKEARDRLKELFELFKSKPSLLIFIHPDPDSIASAIALRRILLRRSSKVVIAYDEAVKRLQNKAMVRLLKIKMTSIKDVKFKDFDLRAVLDGQWNHFPILYNQKVDICIDHHPVEVKHPYKFIDIRPDFGATSSILYEYLAADRIKISRTLATALCYGIKTDTDNFTRDIHRFDAIAFGRLLPAADYYLLRSIDQIEVSLKDLGQFRMALDRIRVKGRKAFVHLDQVPESDILVMIADLLIRVSEIETAMVSGFCSDRLTIIFRNRNPRKHIGLLVNKAFEPPGTAGGHRYAARAEIPIKCLPKKLSRDCPYGEVVEWIRVKLSRAKSKSSYRRSRGPALCAPLAPESNHRHT